MRINWTPLRTLRSDGLEDLVVQHWEEVEIDRDEVPLALDFERLFSLERAGNYRVAGMYAGAELVGYAGFTVMPSMFHRSTLHAFGDAIYVEPAHRGRGLSLIRWCERELAVLGVRKVFFAERPDLHLGHGKSSGKVGKIFARLGYRPTELVWTKLL